MALGHRGVKIKLAGVEPTTYVNNLDAEGDYTTDTETAQVYGPEEAAVGLRTLRDKHPETSFDIEVVD